MGNCETGHSCKYSISFSISRNYTIWCSSFPPSLPSYLCLSFEWQATSATQMQKSGAFSPSLLHQPFPPLSPQPHLITSSFQVYFLNTPSLHSTATSLDHTVTVTHLNFCNNSQIYLSASDPHAQPVLQSAVKGTF